jgi:hypothetical protein
MNLYSGYGRGLEEQDVHIETTKANKKTPKDIRMSLLTFFIINLLINMQKLVIVFIL